MFTGRGGGERGGGGGGGGGAGRAKAGSWFGLYGPNSCSLILNELGHMPQLP